MKQRRQDVKHYSADIFGKPVKSMVTDHGIGLSVDGDSIFKNARLEDVQKFQRVLGLATARWVKALQAKEDVNKLVGDACKIQEAKEETVPVEVRLTGERSIEKTRRRKQDARIFDSFKGRQEDAAINIHRAFEIISGEINTTTMKYGPPTEGGPPNEQRLMWLEEKFYEWAEEAQINGLSVAATLDILAFSKSFLEVDRDRRKKKGWAKDNLLKCLSLYCKLCQWPDK